MTAQWNDIWYQSLDGLQLYARDYSRADAPLTVLCMHGLTRNSADFEEIAAHLSKKYRVVSVDQRGRGRSAYDPNPENYQLPVYCGDMFKLIAEHIPGPVVALGTSMGGLMTMVMSAMKPGIFAGTILNDIGPVIETSGLEKIKGYIGKGQVFESYEQAAQLISIVGVTAFPKFTEADWVAFAHKACRQRADGRVEFAYDPKIAVPILEADTALTPPDMWPMFDALKPAPLLVVRGGLSDLFSDETAQKMVSRHGNAEKVTVPDVGHAPTLSEPVVVDAIDQYFSKHFSAG